ncbi:hypothetical protein AB0M47_02720 [Hamadaea sp. NPDC051192]|uniref:hypothetical protein n=1 Tax=Hamadaea sp. NPDC051192 TaxID=3154940 RepID=UPI0034365C8C
MINQLRDALRAEADAVPAYSVYEPALRTARRRRRRRWSVALTAVAVFILLAISGVPGVFSADAPPAGTTGTQPSIPDRLAFPPAFWPSVTGSPAGPASVLFGGQGFAPDHPERLLENEGDLAVVGATSDVYRMLRVTGYETHAGEDVLLSPDGRSLALPSGITGTPSLLDLSTGGKVKLKGFSAGDYVTPMAWSPDGRTLAVLVNRGSTQIGLVDVPDGSFRAVSTVDPASFARGFDVAFAPDGRQWAYLNEGKIIIVRPDLTEVGRIDVGPSTWLAGKGAWAPDGRLMTVTLADGHWQLRGIDLATILSGQPAATANGRAWSVEGSELAAVRLLGWIGPQPVVAAYKRARNTVTGGRPETHYQAVASVELWRLTDKDPEVLLTAPDNLMSIDISDSAIAGGLTRPADPPRYGILTVLAVAGPLMIASVIGWVLLRRRIRKTRGRASAA